MYILILHFGDYLPVWESHEDIPWDKDDEDFYYFTYLPQVLTHSRSSKIISE